MTTLCLYSLYTGDRDRCKNIVINYWNVLSWWTGKPLLMREDLDVYGKLSVVGLKVFVSLTNSLGEKAS